jgi:hypothetical protein
VVTPAQADTAVDIIADALGAIASGSAR